MTIRQLSIFIENQSGTLQKVLELMKQSRIQIIACTIADTAEYGIFRLICSEPERACSELKAAGVAVAISDVFAIGMKGILIFRTAEAAKAEEVIVGEGLQALSEQDLPLQI